MKSIITKLILLTLLVNISYSCKKKEVKPKPIHIETSKSFQVTIIFDVDSTNVYYRNSVALVLDTNAISTPATRMYANSNTYIYPNPFYVQQRVYYRTENMSETFGYYVSIYLNRYITGIATPVSRTYTKYHVFNSGDNFTINFNNL